MLLQRAISIAANANVNIFAGELVERFSKNLYGQFGMTIAATGINYDLTLGDEQVAIGQEPQITAAAPQFPNDFTFLNFPIRAGKLNRCMVHNTTGAPIVIQVQFRGTLDKLATS